MKSVYRSAQGKKIIISRYEEILEHWPIPLQKLTIPTSYGDTFVIASGAVTDKAVVLLHGSATNSAMWMGDVETLGRTRRVYAVDIIGEPGKSAENRPDSRGSNYGKWLAQVMDGLNLTQASVVGNSLGGWMALDLAAYAPKRVESLVLLASAGLSPINASSFMLKALTFRLMGRKGEEMINKLVFGDIEMPEEVLSFGSLISKHFLPRTKGYGALPDTAFRKLGIPVLYITGEDDKLLPAKKNAQRMKRLVPHADIRVLAGRPHALIGLANEISSFIETKGIKDDKL